MGYKVKKQAVLPVWKKVLMALVGMAGFSLAGCSTCCDKPVMYATPQPAPADVELQACANHAAAAAKGSGQDFKRLRLDTAGRSMLPFDSYVGNTYVATVQDGYGQWFGRKEWRAIRYHCLTDNNGQVLYSFVRAE